MIPPLETYVVVSMAFAVFAAVTAIGSAIVLGVGYERLRAGLERVKEGLDVINRQTGFFSNSLFKLENRVDALDPAMIKPVHDDAPVKTAKKPRATKSRSKKTHVDEIPTTTLTERDGGGITTTISASNLNDWQSYQGLSKDEALANFAQAGQPDSKVKFM
jgi:hypothetical protein